MKFPTAVLALDWTGVELPWVGGALITSGADEPFRQVETVLSPKVVCAWNSPGILTTCR